MNTETSSKDTNSSSESSPYILFPECDTDDMRLLTEGSENLTEIKPYIERYKESIEIKKKSKTCLLT